MSLFIWNDKSLCVFCILSRDNFVQNRETVLIVRTYDLFTPRVKTCSGIKRIRILFSTAHKHQEEFEIPALASISLSLCHSLVRRQIWILIYLDGKGIWIPILGKTALLTSLLYKEKSFSSSSVALKQLG